MSEFKYPMWFKNDNVGIVVEFFSLQCGKVIEANHISPYKIGEFRIDWFFHTDKRKWLDVTDQYKDKAEIPPLKLCGTPYSVEEKERYIPTIKEALEKLIKEEKPNKYKRIVPSTNIDVYDILKAFNVVNPAVQHAVKKLLCAGDRGYKDKVQDLKEALASIERAIELESDNATE